jgi:hypothetical protein
MLLSSEDATVKGQLWEENNQEYLAELAAKEQQVREECSHSKRC